MKTEKTKKTEKTRTPRTPETAMRKTQGVMRAWPTCKVDAKVKPIAFESSACGTFAVEVSSISAAIDAIPLRMAVPFLKRQRRLPVVSVLGGFKIKLDPLQVKVEGSSLNVKGVLGTKGIESQLNCQVDCKMEFDLEGDLCERFCET